MSLNQISQLSQTIQLTTGFMAQGLVRKLLTIFEEILIQAFWKKTLGLTEEIFPSTFPFFGCILGTCPIKLFTDVIYK